MIVFPNREKIAKKNEYPESILHTLDAFYKIAYAAHWQTPSAVKQIFPEAEILKDGRIIIDIANQYHLIVKINPQFGAVHVQFFESYGKLSEILSSSSYLKKLEPLDKTTS
ncbi:type II toxin-antitoxin system HigB family toxin [Rhodocytophaga aerolata]|uniref:Type II toxin-antitoxin system HigB family toxin n=1 Tax=Rhodocytophaga aerolata TaxID=455078 RepID=A0ABT8RB33_9BACT|nr:type II toxin-antitoxin system HigB family toxin [Rhodocytophaga aerolata]MDO1449316.1 type II toxin-antitoxin system HigB family toxin [Rhodocytophaga aerolata]